MHAQPQLKPMTFFVVVLEREKVKETRRVRLGESMWGCITSGCIATILSPLFFLPYAFEIFANSRFENSKKWFQVALGSLSDQIQHPTGSSVAHGPVWLASFAPGGSHGGQVSCLFRQVASSSSLERYKRTERLQCAPSIFSASRLLSVYSPDF